MLYKGRTVVTIAILALLAGSLLTAVLSEASIFAKEQTYQSPNDSATQTGDRKQRITNMTEEQVKKIQSVYRLIQSQYIQEVEPESVIDGAIQGMLQSLEDPYSTYMDAEQAAYFQDAVIESTFSGIGAEVTMQDGRVTVVAPIKDSPAEQAGVRAKDQIISVNGEMLDGYSLNEAVMKIRGKKGTQAKLEIIREGISEPIEIIVVRDDIDIETVYADMLEGNIGKIEIRQFAQETDKRFEEELIRLEQEGMEGLIIDVRNNPGGILPVVINMANLFIDEGKPIVQVEYNSGRREQFKASGNEKHKGYPIVVITNKGSASASEILAASLREAAGATVIGEQTFGKGTVQSTFNTAVKDGSNVKLTIAEWLTPEGNSVNEDGVKPDIPASLPEAYHVSPLPKDEELAVDMVGDAVANLQIMLETIGLVPDRKDGYFSERTEELVKAFQKERELEVTGTVNEETAIALEAAVIEELAKPENDLQLQKAISFVKDAVKAKLRR